MTINRRWMIRVRGRIVLNKGGKVAGEKRSDGRGGNDDTN